MVIDLNDLSIYVYDGECIPAAFRFYCDAELYVKNLINTGTAEKYLVYERVNIFTLSCYTCQEFIDRRSK